MNTHRRSIVAVAVATALVLAGCATPMAKSTVEVPQQFAAAGATEAEPEIAWWDGYGDPVLSRLVRIAGNENRDVKMALERVRAARAGETIARSALLPSIGLQASGSYSDTGRDAAYKAANPDVRRAAAGLDVSWEIDLTGRLRAGSSAAAAEALAAQHGARGVRLLVASDVATHYFTLRGALRQLETMRAIAAAQDETLRLVQARQRAGLASAFDVERARTLAAQSHAAIPPLETTAAVSRHRIAVLIGSQAALASEVRPWDGEIGSPRRARASRLPCWNAGPTCSRCRRSSKPPTTGASRRPPNGFPACSWARCSAATGWN